MDATTSMLGWWSYWKRNIVDVPIRRPGRPPSEWITQVVNPWRLIAALDIAPASVYGVRPKATRRSGALPVHPVTKENVFILSYAAIPIIIQAVWYLFLPNWTWPALVAFAVYGLNFAQFMTLVLRRLHFFMAKYGVFDEDNRGRDLVPDAVVDKTGFNVAFGIFCRILICVLVAYRRADFPSFSAWSLPKIMLFEIALDYYFYCYHRTVHQVPALWRIHARHHMTRHPTPAMTALADEEQELIEVVLVPLLAYATVPLSFHELYVCMFYILYVEAKGHSGIRAYWPNPLLGPILKPFGAEMCIEDHDLHHRFGRSGQSYGKRSRLFDRLWNTVHPRVEGDVAVDDSLPAEVDTVVVKGRLEPTTTD